MTAKIKLNAASGGGSVSLQAPTSTTSNANVELKLPVADGSANQLLKTDGSGNLGWATDQGGKIKKFVYAEMSSDFGMNSTNETDVGGMTASIAKTNASNNTLVELTFAPYMAGSGAGQYAIRVYRDSTKIYENGNGFYRTADDLKATLSSIRFLDTGVNDTSSHTYKMTAQRTAGSNGFSIYSNSLLPNSITLTEMEP